MTDASDETVDRFPDNFGGVLLTLAQCLPELPAGDLPFNHDASELLGEFRNVAHDWLKSFLGYLYNRGKHICTDSRRTRGTGKQGHLADHRSCSEACHFDAAAALPFTHRDDTAGNDYQIRPALSFPDEYFARVVGLLGRASGELSDLLVIEHAEDFGSAEFIEKGGAGNNPFGSLLGCDFIFGRACFDARVFEITVNVQVQFASPGEVAQIAFKGDIYRIAKRIPRAVGKVNRWAGILKHCPGT